MGNIPAAGEALQRLGPGQRLPWDRNGCLPHSPLSGEVGLSWFRQGPTSWVGLASWRGSLVPESELSCSGWRKEPAGQSEGFCCQRGRALRVETAPGMATMGSRSLPGGRVLAHIPTSPSARSCGAQTVSMPICRQGTRLQEFRNLG